MNNQSPRPPMAPPIPPVPQRNIATRSLPVVSMPLPVNFAQQRLNNNQNNLLNNSHPTNNRPLPPPPPIPRGFNNGAQFKNNNQQVVVNQQSNENNQVDAYGPYLNNYDFNQELDYSDTQYIKDLKTLEEFYENQKYTPILEKRYYDYELSWTPPKITMPIDELYSRLKYYDDLLSYEQLSPDQVIEVKKNMQIIIDQIISHDNYDYFKKYGSERLYYNDNYDLDMYQNAFQNIKYYQREDNIDSWGTNYDYVPISLPKNKWWISQEFYFPDQESYFVNFINNNNYSSEILSHPMFTYLNDYGSFQDLDQSPIIEPFPHLDKNVENFSNNQSNANNNVSSQKSKKLNIWQKMFLSKAKKQELLGDNMSNQNNQIEPTHFPKKENPPPPQPTIMPPKHNPVPPQPTIMPPKQNPTPPTTPGKGF